MKITILPEANNIIHTLQAQGFAAYAVGGCVRNALLGLPPGDWDICTDAKPDEMRQVFRGFVTHDYGLKHGTLVVMVGKKAFEVTTFRIDGVYADNRRPESVTFTDDLSLDLSRRDFTVNAMAYNDEEGFFDPFGGLKDLRRNRLRCVGDPDSRFREDALRILRGVRFASAYGFTVESATAAAICRNAPLLQRIAPERVREELSGILCGAHVLKTADDFRDVLAVVLPELSASFGFRQINRHHRYDVWQHILHAVDAVDPQPLLRMTMLLHDIGKPRACTVDAHGVNHFKGHQRFSAELAETILTRLRFPNAFKEDCLELILYHDLRFNGSAAQVKRVLQQLGEEKTRLLFKVQRADVLAQSDYLREEKLRALELAQRQAGEILAQGQCFCLKDLAVNGSDLIALGIPPGEMIGRMLNALLDLVVEEKLPNEREALLKTVSDRMRGHS